MLEIIIICKFTTLQPKLCLTAIFSDMDMRRLIPLVAEEKEAVAAPFQDGGHGSGAAMAVRVVKGII